MEEGEIWMAKGGNGVYGHKALMEEEGREVEGL